MSASTHSRLIGPVGTLVSGSGVAFLVAYLAKPILLRLYPASDFGIVEFVVALVGVLIPVASLRYEDAVVLPEDDEQAAAVWRLSLGLTLLTTGLSAVGVWLFAPLAPEAVRPWLWTVPGLLLLLRAAKLAELWLTRHKRFALLSGGGVAQSITTTASRIGLGVVGAGPAGLLGGFALGHGLSALVWLRETRKRWPADRAPSAVRAAAHRYRRFAQFASPAALINALATRLPFLLLIGAFGAEVLGWFSQAFAVLYVPLALVGTAVAQVFFVTAAEAFRAGSLRRETAEAHRLLVWAGLVPLAGVCGAAPDVFSFVFGEEWREAGAYAARLAPWIFMTAVASPLTRVFDVTERQSVDLWVNAFNLAVVSTGIWLAVSQEDPLAGMTWLGITGFLARAAQAAVALHVAEVPGRSALLHYVVPLLAGTATFAAVHVAGTLLSPAGTTGVFAGCLVLWALVLAEVVRRQVAQSSQA
ncbi:MAG: lipopolysaccharide biosynthesis protein [Rhodothermales bacterium]|nr:lipopolysaccharide biosynthesis protein [Rhodothermales bacterium]MBO6779797.1 lipopolysaccharide biosynthesis protein [Rhodothermales bacterium]